MPKIYEYFGFIFFFYSDEHEPVHVHVRKSGCESIFEIIMEDGKLKTIRCRKKRMNELSDKDKTIAEDFIRKYIDNIINKWVNFFVLKKRIRNSKITKKI
ncbi:MAG: DUF4160 domain-containing protein [Lentimicrobiaceae bacterium]|nr:DUF4160 domain-containing protein [Lentimicrobiaceae bacterium]